MPLFCVFLIYFKKLLSLVYVLSLTQRKLQFNAIMFVVFKISNKEKSLLRFIKKSNFSTCESSKYISFKIYIYLVHNRITFLKTSARNVGFFRDKSTTPILTSDYTIVKSILFCFWHNKTDFFKICTWSFNTIIYCTLASTVIAHTKLTVKLM